MKTKTRAIGVAAVLIAFALPLTTASQEPIEQAPLHDLSRAAVGQIVAQGASTTTGCQFEQGHASIRLIGNVRGVVCR